MGVVNYLSTVFDIDYADGFARANVAIYVFNSQGQLVLIGGDSNVAEDQPVGLGGNGAADLSRGSQGQETRSSVLPNLRTALIHRCGQ